MVCAVIDKDEENPRVSVLGKWEFSQGICRFLLVGMAMLSYLRVGTDSME